MPQYLLYSALQSRDEKEYSKSAPLVLESIVILRLNPSTSWQDCYYLKDKDFQKVLKRENM